MKYNSNIIQILRRHYNLLYHNISPFCEPLSFVHRSQNACFVLQRITLQLDLFLYIAIQILYCIFVRIFLQILHCIWYKFLLYFCMNFLPFLPRFRPYFNMNFLCIYTNFLLSFVTNRLPYILHCFVFVYEFWMLYPWNNDSDCIFQIF